MVAPLHAAGEPFEGSERLELERTVRRCLEARVWSPARHGPVDGAFLEDPADVPAVVLDFVAGQLGVADPSCVKKYTERTA